MKFLLISALCLFHITCFSQLEMIEVNYDLSKTDIEYVNSFAIEYSILNSIGMIDLASSIDKKVNRIVLTDYDGSDLLFSRGPAFKKFTENRSIDSILLNTYLELPDLLFGDSEINVVVSHNLTPGELVEVNDINFLVSNIYARSGIYFIMVLIWMADPVVPGLVYDVDFFLEFRKCQSGIIQFTKMYKPLGFAAHQNNEFVFDVEEIATLK